MTPQEMYKEFNLYFNNLMSNQAPGLLPYEISVYMTKSQYLIEDELYKQYENSESIRKNLSNLVVSTAITPASVSYEKIDNEYQSKFFELPSDLRYIVYESILMNGDADKCVKNKKIHVQPVLHDEYDSIRNNPYRLNIRRAVRLDVFIDGKKFSEIVLKDSNVVSYMIRYIKTPRPIFMEGCSMSDSIEGVLYTGPDAGEMSETLHRSIVETAARLAYQDYKV